MGKDKKKDEGFGFHTVMIITVLFFTVVTFVVLALWSQMQVIKG